MKCHICDAEFMVGESGILIHPHEDCVWRLREQRDALRARIRKALSLRTAREPTVIPPAAMINILTLIVDEVEAAVE